MAAKRKRLQRKGDHLPDPATPDATPDITK